MGPVPVPSVLPPARPPVLIDKIIYYMELQYMNQLRNIVIRDNEKGPVGDDQIPYGISRT